MKELFYRDILGTNPRKREVSIEEISNRTRIRIAKKWICKYFIKETYDSDHVQDLRRWIRMKTRDGCRKNCHILRQVDTRTGENKIFCKVLGEFFVIWGMRAYKIVYVTELRVQIGGRESFERGVR